MARHFPNYFSVVWSQGNEQLVTSLPSSFYMTRVNNGALRCFKHFSLRMKYCVVTVNARGFFSILQNEIWKFFRLLSFTFKGMLTDIGTDRQHSLNFIRVLNSTVT